MINSGSLTKSKTTMKKKSALTEDYYSISVTPDIFRLKLVRPVTLEQAQNFDTSTILKQVAPETKSLILDCREMESYDSYLVLFYSAFEEYCEGAGIKFVAEGVSDDMKEFLRLFGSKEELKPVAKNDLSSMIT